MNRLSIGKMTARATGGVEPLAARLRLDHLLQSADITPRCFPPHAVLLVRRAAARRKVSLSSFQLRPEWESEMRAVVAEFLRRAVVPVRGRVPEGAEAVLFRDEGEWLACLGLRVAAREVEGSWYCRALLGPREAVSSPRTFARALAAAPRSVPAALAHLARWHNATRVLSLLAPREVEEVWTPLAYEWSLDRAGWLPDEMPHAGFGVKETKAEAGTPARAASSGEESRGRGTSERERPHERAPRAAPTGKSDAGETTWTKLLKHEADELSRLAPATRRLLYVALTLAHEPARARGAEFVASVRASLEREEAKGRAQTSRDAGARSGAARPKSRRADETPRAASGAVAKVDESVAVESPKPSPFVRERKRDAPVSSVREESRGDAEVVEAVEADAEAEALVGARPWDDLEGFETELGGVVFLLNLFALAGLPGCFEQELNLPEHVSGWGLAELYGRALLGDLYEPHRSDPLWPTLAHLDGRAPGVAPAHGLPAADAFRLPAEWLARFVPPGDVWSVKTDETRVVARHASFGFVVFERARGATKAGDLESPREIVEAELEALRARGVEVPPLVYVDGEGEEVSRPLSESAVTHTWPELSGPCRRWLNWTLPFVRFLLARAFGVESLSDESSARLLLLKRARVYCTATHVDVVMSMEQIDLRVRRAGLDATPGWVRDLARVVTIHFD